MKMRGLLLGIVMLLGFSARTYAATAFWYEEADALPNENHPDRWGVCTEIGALPCQAGKFSAHVVPNITEGSEPGTPHYWVFPTDINYATEGMGVLDGAGAPAIPSPLANLTEFTVEARFRTTEANPVNNLNGSFFHLSQLGTGNIGWSFDWAFGNGGPNSFAPNYLRVNWLGGNQGDLFGNSSSPAVPYDTNWHVIRVAEKYSAANPADGFVDMWIDNVLIKKSAGDTHTFTQTELGTIRLDINRTFAVSGHTDSEMHLDYIRMADSIFPISEPLNAPGSGCVGNVNGDSTTDGADVAIIYDNWGPVAPGNPADINGDNTVDGADLADVYDCWGLADVGPASVPEPASIGILGVGLIGLLAARRRS